MFFPLNRMTFSTQYVALDAGSNPMQTLLLTSSFDQMPSITAPHILLQSPQKDDLTFDMIQAREVQSILKFGVEQ